MEARLMTNPYYARAIEMIRTTDLTKLETGKHVIDGDNLWVNIVETSHKTPQEARLEVHDQYIDIQVPLSKAESYGIKARKDCRLPDGEMNVQKDILFYKDPVDFVITAQPGEDVTFAPETAHAPCIGEGTLRKAIFKVRVL